MDESGDELISYYSNCGEAVESFSDFEVHSDCITNVSLIGWIKVIAPAPVYGCANSVTTRSCMENQQVICVYDMY